MNIKTEWLSLIQALADTKSVSLAADRIGYTQQAVSYTLSQIEQSFDFRLFERQGRRLQITRDGQRILFLCQQYQHQMQDFAQDLQTMQTHDKTQSWQIARSTSFTSSALLGRILAGVHQAFPDIQLNLEWVLQPQLEALMLKAQIPLGLSFYPAANSRFTSIKLCESPYIWVAHKQYQDAREIPLIGFKYHPLNRLQHKFTEGADYHYLTGFGQAADTAGISSGNLLESIQLVKQGCGKACLPQIDLEAELASGEVIVLAPSSQRVTAYLIMIEDLLPSATVSWFKKNDLKLGLRS